MLAKEILIWNNKFPLDRWWRLKHSKGFKTKDHLDISQLDILFEWLEIKLFEKSEVDRKLRKEKEDLLNRGILLTDRNVNSEEEDDNLFENLDLGAFNIS